MMLLALLKGSPGELRSWIEPDGKISHSFAICLLLIILGFGSYGLTVGFWKSPLMGAYVGLKMPLLIFTTLICNSLLNGMIGLLLGSGLGFRQSFQAQLVSFAVAALILGSLTPVTFFMALNAPEYANFLVSHTLLIAYAGVMANIHLLRLLLETTPSRKIALLTLASWLGGNAFVGAQFSWIFRPFFGVPGLPVTFLRDNPMQGTFYEALWHSLSLMTNGYPLVGLLFAMAGLALFISPLFFTKKSPPLQSPKFP